MNKFLAAGAAALALGAGGVVAGCGDDEGSTKPSSSSKPAAAPTVEIGVAASKMTVEGADALRTGPTRLHFTLQGKGDRAFTVLALRDGVTRAQAEKALPGLMTADAVSKVGSIVASGYGQGGTDYTTTVDLPAGKHLLVSAADKPEVQGELTVGTERSTAAAPKANATIDLEDYAFGGPSTLPARGVVRIENTGKQLHHTLFMPLKQGVDGDKVLREVKAGKKPRWAIGGPPSALNEMVSPGTVNDVELQAKAGKYLLVCFLQDTPKQPPHAALGMAKVVTVQ